MVPRRATSFRVRRHQRPRAAPDSPVRSSLPPWVTGCPTRPRRRLPANTTQEGPGSRSPMSPRAARSAPASSRSTSSTTSLPLARTAPARPRLPAGHPDLPGHRRAGPRRRHLDPLGPGPLSSRRRPGRALGGEPSLGRRARHADGAHRGLLVRALGRPVVPHRHRARRQRDPDRRRPLLLSRTGPTWARSSRAWPTQRKLSGTVSLDEQRSTLESLRLFRGQSRSRGPAHLSDPPEPRTRDGARLPLDPGRHPLLAARAASHSDAPAR